jgi:hypothetical protein
MKDKLLEKYLKMYQTGWKIDVIENLPKEDQIALSRASKLRVFKT